MEENENIKKFLMMMLCLLERGSLSYNSNELNPEILNFRKYELPLTDFASHILVVLKDEFDGDVNLRDNSIYIDLLGNNHFRLDIQRYEGDSTCK